MNREKTENINKNTMFLFLQYNFIISLELRINNIIIVVF